jgi:hypothetical protein
MMMDGVAWRVCEGETPADDGIPYATHEGELDIMGIKLKCYQLNDGRRVFDADAVNELFGGELFNR